MWRSPLWLVPWWVLCAVWAVSMRLGSPGILEGGDGVQHYQIARYAWDHPQLLLHHWGKPLFTLFASPFAQLGHWGMALFNAVCLIGTAWAADGPLRKAGVMARLLFAPLLLLTPVYGTMVLAGMTEVFFGLLTIVVLHLLWQERYVMALLVASFMPFARPEYVAFVPFALAWVAYKRKWKALPFVLMGHVIYGLAGLLVFGDLFWAFHQDPYTGAADIYGSGGPWSFVEQAPEVFGVPLLALAGLALVLGAAMWILVAETRPNLRLLVVVGLLPCLAILTVHSVLWWQGWKGSLGLVRVMATAAPLLVLCSLWPIGTLSVRLLHTWPGRLVATLVIGSYLLWGQHLALLAFQPLPVPEQAYERFMQEVGERASALRGDHDRLLYYHPQVAFRADVDPFDTALAVSGWRPEEGRPSLGLRNGDLLVWDAHFGPNEGRTPLEQLLADPGLELVGFATPRERLIVLGGRPFEVFIFRAGSNERRSIHDTLFGTEQRTLTWNEGGADTLACGRGASTWCFNTSEFPLTLPTIGLDTSGQLYAQITVTGSYGPGGEGLVKCVLERHTEGVRDGYWSQDLQVGGNTIVFRVGPPTSQTIFKLYLWNTGRMPFAIADLGVEATHVVR